MVKTSCKSIEKASFLFSVENHITFTIEQNKHSGVLLIPSLLIHYRSIKVMKGNKMIKTTKCF